MALLEVKNLTKKFKSKKGEVLAVDHLNFTADKGQIFGLLGPNGAGKTTTIRVLATTLQSTEGTATVAGFDINKDPEKVRENVGVLTTDIGLYDRFSGRENLHYYGRLYGLSGEKLTRRINELSVLLEMDDFIDRRAGKYSTGMKQKVAIARSVIHDPQVIIFDEPTAGLDVLASQTVIKFMKKAREMGKLVVLSTHLMHDAERLCDRIVIIHRGKLITDSTILELKERTGAANMEDVFLKLVKERRLETISPEDLALKQNVQLGKKIKILKILRISSFIAMLIGLVIAFAFSGEDQKRYIGTALILLGALGVAVCKTLIKKYKK